MQLPSILLSEAAKPAPKSYIPNEISREYYDSLMTGYEMKYYYSYYTKQRCKCGAVEKGVLSQTLFVYAETKHKDPYVKQLPITAVVARYMALFNITFEQAETYLPELPVFIREHELDVEFCHSCLEVALGNQNRSAMMPPENDVGHKLNSIYGLNDPLNGGLNKVGNLTAKQKTPTKAQEKQQNIAKVQFASLDDLLK